MRAARDAGQAAAAKTRAREVATLLAASGRPMLQEATTLAK
jgi:hypothetical protein